MWGRNPLSPPFFSWVRKIGLANDTSKALAQTKVAWLPPFFFLSPPLLSMKVLIIFYPPPSPFFLFSPPFFLPILLGGGYRPLPFSAHRTFKPLLFPLFRPRRCGETWRPQGQTEPSSSSPFPAFFFFFLERFARLSHFPGCAYQYGTGHPLSLLSSFLLLSNNSFFPPQGKVNPCSAIETPLIVETTPPFWHQRRYPSYPLFL